MESGNDIQSEVPGAWQYAARAFGLRRRRHPEGTIDRGLQLSRDRDGNLFARNPREVLRRIGEKPALATEDIDVQSSDHNVYLYGSVSSRMDSEEAEAIARTVRGVRKAFNALELSES